MAEGLPLKGVDAVFSLLSRMAAKYRDWPAIRPHYFFLPKSAANGL